MKIEEENKLRTLEVLQIKIEKEARLSYQKMFKEKNYKPYIYEKMNIDKMYKKLKENQIYLTQMVENMKQKQLAHK